MNRTTIYTTGAFAVNRVGKKPDTKSYKPMI